MSGIGRAGSLSTCRLREAIPVQIQHGGERRWLGLGTANKKDAAALTLKLFLDVRANGWEVVMRRRRGDPAVKKVNVTIGEYIEAVAGRISFRQRR